MTPSILDLLAANPGLSAGAIRDHGLDPADLGQLMADGLVELVPANDVTVVDTYRLATPAPTPTPKPKRRAGLSLADTDAVRKALGLGEDADGAAIVEALNDMAADYEMIKPRNAACDKLGVRYLNHDSGNVEAVLPSEAPTTRAGWANMPGSIVIWPQDGLWNASGPHTGIMNSASAEEAILKAAENMRRFSDEPEALAPALDRTRLYNVLHDAICEHCDGCARGGCSFAKGYARGKGEASTYTPPAPWSARYECDGASVTPLSRGRWEWAVGPDGEDGSGVAPTLEQAIRCADAVRAVVAR